MACLMMVASLAGCSTIEGWFSSDKVDYKTSARQTQGLEVPPDLTQLARDSRAQIQGGSVSASALEAQQAQKQQGGSRPTASAAAQSGAVAVSSVGEVRIERAGTTRYLHTPQLPEQVWPQVAAFWKEQGFEITRSDAAVGVMDTNWVEDKSKLPNDFLRRTIGKVFENLFSSGEREMYTARVERTEQGGTDIFIAQHGQSEVYSNQQRDSTAWQNRASDPLREAEMLSRLLIKLGGKPELLAAASPDASASSVGAAGTTAITSAATPASTLPDNRKARPLSEVPDNLVVNEPFERAWRRVGQSLDRHGFTIEDRDRTLGLFFLRYADPSKAGEEEPNFFQRLFTSKSAAEPIRYRVSVKAQGNTTVVSILDSKGQQQTGDLAKNILNLLMDDLR